MDYTSGDLYEAEELYRDGHPIKNNRTIFVRNPDGCTIEPIIAKEGQYLGRPTTFYEDKIYQLLVDFVRSEINILCFNPDELIRGGEIQTLATLPLSITKDCYNLMLHTEPIILTRQSCNQFQLLWSETKGQMDIDFQLGNSESFICMKENKLYFTSFWEKETPEYEYHEEVIVRNIEGTVIDKYEGGMFEISPGHYWVLE